MTDVELRNSIPNLVKSELAGSEKYFEMATIMSNGNHHELAQIFRDISHEEYTHAKHLKYIGEKMGLKFEMNNEFEAIERKIYDL